VFRRHNDSIFFLKSIFDKRPPTAYFPYPRYCTPQKDPEDRLRTYERDDVE
jgi:hypothetical protein